MDESQALTFGLALRLARQRRGLTQAQLATAAQVSLSLIQRVERGRYRPRLDAARRLAAAVGASLDDQLAGRV